MLGVYKKLEAAGRKKGCKKVKDWARSISNHMYWCASSSGGDGELVQQKWLSILNHVTNVHEGHGDKFPECEHGDLEDRDWMKKGNYQKHNISRFLQKYFFKNCLTKPLLLRKIQILRCCFIIYLTTSDNFSKLCFETGTILYFQGSSAKPLLSHFSVGKIGFAS